MYITMHFLSVLILLSATGLCMPFQKLSYLKISSLSSSSSSLSKLSALRKPKKFEEMDDFDKFEKYSREGNDALADLYLRQIHVQLKNETEEYIPVFDMTTMVESMGIDIMPYLEGEIPHRPRTEAEIEEETFEGYLRNEFMKIPKKISSLVHFEEFYEWRKKAGVVLSKDEVRDYFEMVVGEHPHCDLMQFITINYLIDESDASLF